MNHPPIHNGNSQPIRSTGNSLPDMGDTLGEYLQDMSFVHVTKSVVGFECAEALAPVAFKGTKQPYKPTEMELEKIGFRAWRWTMVHSTSDLSLKADDIITIWGQNYRVMSTLPYEENGYYQYKLVDDYQ
jgi:hypothetical protein